MKDDHTNCVVVDGALYLHPTNGWKRALIVPRTSKRYDDKRKARRYHLENISLDPIQVAVDGLTNNQRNHWARSDYPQSLKKIKAFAKGKKCDAKKKN